MSRTMSFSALRARLPVQVLVAGLTLAAACSGDGSRAVRRTAPDGSGAAASDATGRPRLVVLLVIDHWPAWSFEQRRPHLTRGFARLLAEGEWRAGRHPSMSTVTGPGHALLGTGEPPARSGIISNVFWSREEQRLVAAAAGPDGNPSAQRMRVPGLGDAIAASHTGAKAVGVALKVRAARLPLGAHGLAIYYDSATGTWKTHGAPAPAWIDTYTSAHPITLAPWTPSDPALLAKLTGTVDAQRGEVGSKGFGPTFPHDPAKTEHPNSTLFTLPLGDELTLDMATAAIDGEKLGADASPDLLVVSLSAHDYIGHGWGHESWESLDGQLRLDESLDKFLAALDDKVGRGQWAMVVTSDHGGAPLPERVNGGRFTEEQVQRAANAAASTVLGTGTWIGGASWPNVAFTAAALAQNKKELTNAYRKVIFALRSFPGIAIADRSDAFIGGCDERTGDARAICFSLDPERTGEIIYIPKRGWIIENEGEPLATAHGSPYDYDRNVPVILLPFGRASHAPQTSPGAELSLADIAPLVASWLGVPAPTTLPR